jgi:hypothetical protein
MVMKVLAGLCILFGFLEIAEGNVAFGVVALIFGFGYLISTQVRNS